jgi:hypothetical protein
MNEFGDSTVGQHSHHLRNQESFGRQLTMLLGLNSLAKFLPTFLLVVVTKAGEVIPATELASPLLTFTVHPVFHVSALKKPPPLVHV